MSDVISQKSIDTKIGNQPIGAEHPQDLLEFLDREFARPEPLLKKILGRVIPLYGMVKGLNVTRKAIFAKKITVQYPEQKLKLSDSFRGKHVLLNSPEGDQICICCNACANICPVNCIEIKFEPGRNPEKRKRDIVEYNVDLTRCLFCGLCQEMCPEFCLVLGPDYEYSDTTRGPGLLKARMEDILRKATRAEWDEIQARKAAGKAKPSAKPDE